MRLAEIQSWFGAMISQPLQENHLLPPQSPFGKAAKYISASPTLKPHQRIQIYHQQYWWRLLKCLQTNFPTLVRLFGYENFQTKLAVPYLSCHPPSHWALCKFGETFPGWLQENYREEDSYLVAKAAEIDWAANQAFWIGSLPVVDFDHLSREETLTKRIHLQTHIRLFSLEGDFFTFREEFLKQEPEYYYTNDFPEMTYGDYAFVLYRTPKNMVTWKSVSHTEMWVLAQFEKGNTIEGVCAQLEQMGKDMLEEALSQLPFWFKQWTVLKWFGQS